MWGLPLGMLGGLLVASKLLPTSAGGITPRSIILGAALLPLLAAAFGVVQAQVFRWMGRARQPHPSTLDHAAHAVPPGTELITIPAHYGFGDLLVAMWTPAASFLVIASDHSCWLTKPGFLLQVADHGLRAARYEAVVRAVEQYVLGVVLLALAAVVEDGGGPVAVLMMVLGAIGRAGIDRVRPRPQIRVDGIRLSQWPLSFGPSSFWSPHERREGALCPCSI